MVKDNVIEWWDNDQAARTFREVFEARFLGPHVFDAAQRRHFTSESNVPVEVVWLDPMSSMEIQYRVSRFTVTTFESFERTASNVPFYQQVPLSSSVCEFDTLKEIEDEISEGAKALAAKANKAIIEVLLEAGHNDDNILFGNRNLGTRVAEVVDSLSVKGLQADKVIFSDRVKARLLDQGVVISDREIHNESYVGKTRTGQHAFVSEVVPIGMAIIFASSATLLIFEEPRFEQHKRKDTNRASVSGYLYFNPIVRNTEGVVVIEGIDKVLNTTGRMDTRTLSGQAKYVDEGRLDELQHIRSPRYDLSKLIKLCEELNVAYESASYYSVSMLTRAILDHIPPIFGCDNFNGVANNYKSVGKNKSFKNHMRRLHETYRQIADLNLHSQIRSKEPLPNSNQIDCRVELDILLSEVIVILHGDTSGVE